MNNDYISIVISIVGMPKVVGEITALGKWNGSSDCRDPYSDIAEAACKFPRGEIVSYMLVNNKTRNYLYMVDTNREPFIETVFRLFGYDQPENTCCDLVTSYIKEIIIKSILRINNTLSDDIVLLVSNKNSIVVIHV